MTGSPSPPAWNPPVAGSSGALTAERVAGPDRTDEARHDAGACLAGQVPPEVRHEVRVALHADHVDVGPGRQHGQRRIADVGAQIDHEEPVHPLCQVGDGRDRVGVVGRVAALVERQVVIGGQHRVVGPDAVPLLPLEQRPDAPGHGIGGVAGQSCDEPSLPDREAHGPILTPANATPPPDVGPAAVRAFSDELSADHSLTSASTQSNVFVTAFFHSR